jgi:hypothetical protein
MDDVTVTDAKGHKLTVHEMDPADKLDLFEAAAKNNGNGNWLGMALLACSVTAIDGQPIPMPKNPEQVKALARRLGNAGIDAVSVALSEPVATPADVNATIETAKN